MLTERTFPELEAAKEDAERLIDGLIEDVLEYDHDRSDSAAGAVGWLRSRMTEAILRAYPRARTSRQRENLLGMLDGMILGWDTQAVAFLGRVAHHDEDEDVRLTAECILRFLRTPHESGHVGRHEDRFENDDLAVDHFDGDWC